MKTDVVKPKDVFYNPTRLIVPLFQRPYVWSKEEQWEPLWQDVIRLIEVISEYIPSATHFLGAIVIQQVPTTLGSLPAWNVIDGQQRLTTIQLLLDALHSELLRRNWPALADQIEPLVENPPAYREDDNDRYKLWPTNRDRVDFAAIMSAPTPVDYTTIKKSRLRDAHKFFAESIADWIGEDRDIERRARMLVATITDRLEIASIRLDAQEDAQAIFETLNARGTPLSAADLIKNFVFQRLGGSDPQAEAAYLKYWADFETPWWESEVTTGRIKNSRSSLFFWQWLQARMLVEFPIREVFTQFKHYVATVSPDISKLLPGIKLSADRYRAIIEGSARQNGPLSRVELFSYRVGTLDSEIARPLLIWLDEPEQSAVHHEERERALEVLESWFVRRALVKAPSQGSNRFVIDLLKHLNTQPKDGLAAAVQAYLASSHLTPSYLPGDAEVREALTGATVYWKYLRVRLRMVLEALEDAKRGYPDGAKLAMGPVARGRGTIEHLMPQKWRKNWPGDFSDDQEVLRDRIIQQLGNLTLVTQALNSKVSNGSWVTKQAHFESVNDVLITNEAVKLGAGVWDESIIVNRTSRLIDEILSIWPVPEGHIGLPFATQPAAPVVNVDIAQLVASGWLESSAALRALPGAFSGTEAVIAQDGRLYIGDVAYETPSGAAKAVNGGIEVNGWKFWGIAESSRTLDDLRADYLQSLGEADAEIHDEVHPESDYPSARVKEFSDQP